MSEVLRRSASAIRCVFSAARPGDVDAARGDRADGELLEVRVRGVGQAALLGRGEDRDRAGLAGRHEVGPLERVHGDVDLLDARAVVAADLLADVEHRRLVALALADDDRAGDVGLVHRPAHRLGRRLVGLVALPLAHEPGGRDRGGLGDADHLEREELLHRTSAPSVAEVARRR